MGYAFFWIFFDDMLGFRRVWCGWFVEMATGQKRCRKDNYGGEHADESAAQTAVNAMGEMTGRTARDGTAGV